jgi:FkbM family methyltransferase
LPNVGAIESVTFVSSEQANRFFRRLISVAQAMPRNWFGQQLAQLARKLVLRLADLPIRSRVDGLNFEFHIRDNASEKKYLFMPWRFDLAERSLLVKEMPKDAVFVDIGANVGIYSLYVASHLGPNGRVIAFEPNPSAYQRLSTNVALNEATLSADIALLQLGVSAKDEIVELYLDDGNLGGSSLVMESANKTTIECKPLLDVLQSQGVEKIHGLKIDIEGAEDIALTPFLQRAPASLLPRWIVIENSQHLWKTDLTALILGLGYQLRHSSRMNSVYWYAQD